LIQNEEGERRGGRNIGHLMNDVEKKSMEQISISLGIPTLRTLAIGIRNF
jgi:hypothetical protein